MVDAQETKNIMIKLGSRKFCISSARPIFNFKGAGKL